MTGSSSTQPPPPSHLGLEDVAFALLAVFFATAAVVWAAGEVSGRLWSGSWPGVRFSDMPAILLTLVHNPGRPATAWATKAPGAVPGPAAFYAVLSMIAATLGTAGVGLRHRWEAEYRVPHKRDDVDDTATWAGPRDLRPLRVKAPQGGRLTLGRNGRHLLATEARHSVCVLGPTQSFKTTGFAVPAILEWDGPVLAASVKDDLVAHTLAWRQRQGTVWIYDPTVTTGRAGAGWSPLSAANSWGGAQRVASQLCSLAQTRGVEDAEFWYLAAEKLLAPYLLAAALEGRNMSQVVRWVDNQEMAEVEDILKEADELAALDAAWASWRREERQRSSIFTTAEIALRAFSDPCVAASTSEPIIDPAGFLDGRPNTLYLCAPAHEQQRLQPLFGALVQEIVNAVYERSARRLPLSKPLLVVLDEAANIAPLRDLDTLASTAAGIGIQLVTVWQDFAQLESRYGRRSHTVINNHRAKVVLSGISDPATLDYVSRLAGEHEVHHGSVTTDLDGRRSNTESTTYRNLAPAHALRRIRPGRGILVYGHLLPAQLELRPWYKDHELARRARSEEQLPGLDTGKPAFVDLDELDRRGPVESIVPSVPEE